MRIDKIRRIFVRFVVCVLPQERPPGRASCESYHHEENLSAQRTAPQAHPRLPRPIGDPRRSRRVARAARARPSAPERLTQAARVAGRATGSFVATGVTQHPHVADQVAVRAAERVADQRPDDVSPAADRPGDALRQLGFARSARLIRPAEYRRVFADNRRCGDAFCTLLARPNGLPHGRLGLAIAKRRVRRSVDRSRIKRLIRESFRANQAQLAGLDIVVMARDAAAGAERRQITRGLDRQWPRLVKRCADWPAA